MRFDRILGILLLLRSGQTVSAAELARRFEVSPRTIYRDIDTLSSLGVPVYAERGREGGFRLLEGYFLPPLMFSTGEAVSLLLGLTLLRSLRSKPFPTELETAEKKLLAAVPDYLHSILAAAPRLIGFEALPHDVFHPEPSEPPLATVSSPPEAAETTENSAASLFLQAILERKTVQLQYRSPYRGQVQKLLAAPMGMLWDRDRWYLIGQPAAQNQELRLWRTDRVLEIKLSGPAAAARPEFDVRTLLDRRWLQSAMAHWVRQTPVRIRLTPAQAERLRRDWYYRHACFEPMAKDQVLMTFGEDNQAVVLELLRWLGPGAELIEPAAWRAIITAELQQMLADHAGVRGGPENQWAI